MLSVCLLLFMQTAQWKAPELLQRYRADPRSFQKKEVLSVAGTVVRKDTIMGTSFFTLRTGEDEESVVCILGKNKRGFDQIAKGKAATVSGEFDGRKDHIRLQKCQIAAGE